MLWEEAKNQLAVAQRSSLDRMLSSTGPIRPGRPDSRKDRHRLRLRLGRVKSIKTALEKVPGVHDGVQS